MEVTLLIILLMIFGSAFFSGSETALTATSRALMHQLEQDGDKRAATGYWHTAKNLSARSSSATTS